MKINEKGLVKFAVSGAPPDKEGYLHKRGDFNKGFQKRWFVLKGNLLFYYDKRIDKEPVGMIVMEGCTVELTDLQDGFTFMIHFPGSHSRTYILSADSQEDMESWMKVLSVASYDYMKTCIAELHSQLEAIAIMSNKSLMRSVLQDVTAYDYMKTCVAELRSQLEVIATRSNKSLMRSVLQDSSNLSKATCSMVVVPQTSNENSPASRPVTMQSVHRHNPFDADGSIERDSLNLGSEKYCRTFLEMHNEFGAQIKETMDWYSRLKHGTTV